MNMKEVLERFYRDFDFRERMRHDPIEFPHRYVSSADIEAAGFISSCFAYGKVELFRAVLETIFSKMGESPFEFLAGFNLKRDGGRFGGLKYRFNENADILCLFFLLHEILKKEGSLMNAFRRHYSEDDRDIRRGLTGFIGELLGGNTSPVYGTDIRPRGLRQFLSSPAHGSTCKRANLFLRWMVRDRDIDFGIWDGIPKNKLIIPLDTHIARISRCLGFTERKSQDWKTAVEITESLKGLDPEDPLKYDFALCHHGISGLCRGRGGENCQACALNL
ncbi:MAG: TIGR02757 family protein [Candidatus Sulfobium sp.]|jgi:uncharacterized protein (TIGR02757 family)